MFDAILFDLDGTLVDSVPGIEYSMRCALTATGVRETMRDVRALLGPPIRVVFERALGPLPAAILDDLEREFRASYDEVGWQRTQACERAASTLGGLSSLGVRNFVVTNKPKAPTEKILARLRLDGFCSGVVCRDSVSPPLASKSDVVRHTMQKFALLGSETLVVGDSVDDARAAQACGMRFVAMSQGYGGAHCQSEAPVAAVCAALSELLPLVATWRQPSRGEP
ncbi:MAG: hypothetical protein A3H95_06570 [Acidobacteria bacterium RIFCSPLOWO2_02_FULL_64_15]|nr:MAG: hypothetical protein A3H95_06570 [Acidobacteria bacterium RIFCSPLOWO2_02_FULL_64_15]